MNLPAEVPVEIALPRYGIVPQTMHEAIQLAGLMATAKLVPAGLQKSPADCLMVIQQAIRWDMDPFAVAQECSVISGKLMYSGKLVAAVINARGNLDQRLTYTYSSAGVDRTISISGTLHGELEPREVIVTWKDAKTNNTMWTKQPDQQLMYHGVRVWGRRHMPELMLGVQSPEEFDEGPRRPAPPAPNVLLPLAISPPLSPAAESPEGATPTSGDVPAPEPSVGIDGGAGTPLSVDALMLIDRALTLAAALGMAKLEEAWNAVPAEARAALKQALERRHKPAARLVDGSST